MILDQIVELKKKEVEESKNDYPISSLLEGIENAGPARNFKQALLDKECAIIAEVKRKSPSRGTIRNEFDPLAIAEAYEKNGAAAVSVLTDEAFFGGKKEFVKEIRGKILLPVLRKEFIIDPYQVYETKHLTADAILLLARLLKNELASYVRLAMSLDLFPLVEIHSEEDLDFALATGAELIGVNNRDLATFETDVQTSLKLASLIPKDRIVIAESGIHSRKDVEILMHGGIRAFLVGESLMRADDVGQKLRELTGR